MTRRSQAWLAIAITAIISLAAAAATIGTTHDVTLSETQIQERIDRQLSKGIERKGIKVTSASIRLEQGRALVAASIDGSYLRQPFATSISAVGAPRYGNGAFYFTPEAIKIEQFTFRGAAPSDKLKAFADGLKGRKLKEAIKDNADDAETWIKSAAENMAMYALARIPVYTLKDSFKGIVIRAALQDVRVDGDKLHIRLSILQLTLTVVLFGLALLLSIGVAIALLMHPEWLMAGAVLGILS